MPQEKNLGLDQFLPPNSLNPLLPFYEKLLAEDQENVYDLMTNVKMKQHYMMDIFPIMFSLEEVCRAPWASAAPCRVGEAAELEEQAPPPACWVAANPPWRGWGSGPTLRPPAAPRSSRPSEIT